MTRLEMRGRRSRLAALGVAAVTSAAMLSSTTGAPAAADPQGPKPPNKVKLQVLALNDFHGQLEALDPAATSSGRINSTPAGGAEYLASHLAQLREKAAQTGRHSVTVAAGDLIGATPLLSAAFHDEPTIEAMNEMGLELSSVGNHEFDEGWRELVRMQNGGCIDDGDGADNQNSCPDGPFSGAEFQYLSANVLHDGTTEGHEEGETVFPGVSVKEYAGIKVGFIGMTLENTPNIVTQAGVEGLTFTDEVETANAAAEQLQADGVEAIVVLLHEGGFPADRTAYDSCPGISGPIVDINGGLSPAIDTVITGHTHQAYNCQLADPSGAPRLVTSASSLGRVVTELELKIDRATGDIDRSSAGADNLIVTRDVETSPVITELIAKYKELVAPIATQVIGTLAEGVDSVTRTADDSGESSLGNLVADAQKADASLLAGGPVPEIAFMNPGGIRADLLANDAGQVTYEAAFTTQPFNNYDVAMNLTGAQILALLEQQWSGMNSVESPKILQVSGITYTYDDAAPAGSRVVTGSVLVNGAPIVPDQTYRVTANSFLADGGDGFGVFKEATDKYIGGLDIDALAAYLEAHQPYTPVATDRISVQ